MVVEKNYLMVRAMDSKDKDFAVFFDNNVVAVGWSGVNFSSYQRGSDSKKLRDAIKKRYYSSKDWHPPLVGKRLNEIERFHNIKSGDFIIIPFKNSIRMAIAKDRHKHDTAIDSDLSNQIEVEYIRDKQGIKTISRNALSEKLQRRLRVRGSIVSNLCEFKDEIEQIFQLDNYSWRSVFEEKENKLIESLKKTLLHNIQRGTTNLTTGGIGLEYLVKELFECEGYDASVYAKTAFPDYADADVLATKTDKFQDIKIIVQVKHHSGFTNKWGLEQLKKIKKIEEFNDYKFMLITSAKISPEIKEYSNISDIVTFDGSELVDWICENIDKLSIATKIKLGISSVPQINI